MYVSHLPDMYKPCKEDNCEGCPIVFDKYADIMLEEGASADDTAEVADHEYQERDHN